MRYGWILPSAHCPSARTYKFRSLLFIQVFFKNSYINGLVTIPRDKDPSITIGSNLIDCRLDPDVGGGEVARNIRD